MSIPQVVQYGCLLVAWRGRPVLVWTRDPMPSVREQMFAGHGVAEAGRFQTAAAGRDYQMHQDMCRYMEATGASVFVLERGPFQHLTLEDMASITERAMAGQFRPVTPGRG